MASTTPRRRREQHAKERRARRHLRTWSCVNRISLDSENEPRFLTAESTVMRASMARMRRPRFVTSTQLGINSAKPITDAEVPSPPAPDPEPEPRPEPDPEPFARAAALPAGGFAGSCEPSDRQPVALGAALRGCTRRTVHPCSRNEPRHRSVTNRATLSIGTRNSSFVAASWLPWHSDDSRRLTLTAGSWLRDTYAVESSVVLAVDAPTSMVVPLAGAVVSAGGCLPSTYLLITHVAPSAASTSSGTWSPATQGRSPPRACDATIASRNAARPVPSKVSMLHPYGHTCTT